MIVILAEDVALGGVQPIIVQVRGAMAHRAHGAVPERRCRRGAGHGGPCAGQEHCARKARRGYVLLHRGHDPRYHGGKHGRKVDRQREDRQGHKELADPVRELLDRGRRDQGLGLLAALGAGGAPVAAHVAGGDHDVHVAKVLAVKALEDRDAGGDGEGREQRHYGEGHERVAHEGRHARKLRQERERQDERHGHGEEAREHVSDRPEEERREGHCEQRDGLEKEQQDLRQERRDRALVSLADGPQCPVALAHGHKVHDRGERRLGQGRARAAKEARIVDLGVAAGAHIVKERRDRVVRARGIVRAQYPEREPLHGVGHNVPKVRKDHDHDEVEHAVAQYL